MQAGRELDALIAEKFMGSTGHNKYKCPACAAWFPGDLDPPPYSTDMAAAWQVWGFMREDYRRWDLFVAALVALSRATYSDNPTDDLLRYLTPEFICRAALKAVGHSVKVDT